MFKLLNNFVIYGKQAKGSKFRPSDWAERLVDLHIPPDTKDQCVYVTNIDGIKGLSVKQCLKDVDPCVYDHITNFAVNNNLIILEK